MIFKVRKLCHLSSGSSHYGRYVTYLVAGTTCATVLTQAILTEGCKSVATGVNVMDLRTGINMAVDAVVSDLKKRALMLSTPEEITQVLHLQYTLPFLKRNMIKK